MSIINNMPSKGGMTINGLIESYNVYAGKTVNAGDFVKFVNGVSHLEEATSELSGSRVGGNSLFALEMPNGYCFLAHSGDGASNSSSTFDLNCGLLQPGVKTNTFIDSMFKEKNSYGWVQVCFLLENNRVLIIHQSGSSDACATFCTVKDETIVLETSITLSQISDMDGSSRVMSGVILPNGNLLLTWGQNYSFAALYSISGTTVNYIESKTLSQNSDHYELTRLVKVTDTTYAIIFRNEYSSSSHRLGMTLLQTDGETLGGTLLDSIIDSTADSGSRFDAILCSQSNIFIAHKKNSSGHFASKVLTIEGLTYVESASSTLNDGENSCTKDIVTILISENKIFCVRGSTSGQVYGVIVNLSNNAIIKNTEVSLFSNGNAGIRTHGYKSFTGDIFLCTSYSGTTYKYDYVSQLFSVANDLPSTLIKAPIWETQVTSTLETSQNGVANVSGTGGTLIEVKDKIEIYVPNITE